LRHHNIEMHPEAGSAGIHALGRTQDSQLQTCVSLARALL